LVRQSSSDIAKLLKPLAPWIPSKHDDINNAAS
jgi:hypothetical protein